MIIVRYLIKKIYMKCILRDSELTVVIKDNGVGIDNIEKADGAYVYI